jgi:type I restriction enzyme S subunit
MQSEKFRKQIDQISTGSTVFGISQPLLLGVKIVIPDINIQKKIGEMYKTLRKKIIVNREIKREIENFSRTLYNFWFNQFEFPTGSKRNYKSYGEEMVYNVTFKKEIPKGWVVKKFGDLIVENKKSTIQVGDAIKINGSIPFFTSGDDILQVEQFMVDGTNIFLNTGGNANVNFYNGKASYSTDTWCIRGKDNLTNYLALYLISIKDFLYTKFFHGTGLKHLQKELLKNELILVPSNEALESLNRVFDKFSLIMSHFLDENHRLEEFKKYIFPLLTTGQVIFEKDKL